MKKEKIEPYEIAHALIHQKEQIIKTNMVNELIYLYNDGYWDFRNSIPMLKQMVQRILTSEATDYLVNEIIDHIKRETYFKSCELVQNRRYICLNNCVCDIKKEKTLDFSPKIFVTTKIPVTFDPEQYTHEIKRYCSALVHKDDAFKLQEHIGDILSPNTASKKLLYMYGGSHSGKSTFLRIIQNLIGRNNCCSLTLGQLSEKFTNMGIYERMANICSEMPYKINLKNLEHIKVLTGGDTITIQQKYVPAFKYLPIIKHIFAANGIPHIDLENADSALYSRFDFIVFPNSFKPDPSIIPKYTTEPMKSAWFNWMLEGYHRLRDNGWQFTNQLDIGNVERLFATAGIERDEFLVWLTENHIPSPSDHIEKKQMHKGYLEHCKSLGISSRYRYPYESFCKRMLNIKDFPILSARRGPKGKQKPVFMGIKKLNK